LSVRCELAGDGPDGQCGPQRDIDPDASIDRPAGGIEHRAQRTLPELEPGEQHRWTRDEEKRAGDRDGHLPGRQLHKADHNRRQRSANVAKRQADGGENPGKLADVERLGLGRLACSSDRIGRPGGELLVGGFVLGGGKFRV